MWARMGSFLVKPGGGDALRTTYNQEAVPKVRSQPGNLGCFLLEPEKPEEPYVVLTLWRDRAAAETYEVSGVAAEVVGLVRAHFAGPPTLLSYSSASLGGLAGGG